MRGGPAAARAASLRDAEAGARCARRPQGPPLCVTQKQARVARAGRKGRLFA